MLAATLLLTLLPAVTAGAATCPSPGGARIPFEIGRSSRDFVFSGRGWGHGVGMSQWGAQGAAKLGCTAPQIIRAYYRGVEISTRDSSMRVRVGLEPDTPSDPLPTVTTIVNESGEGLSWRLEGAERTTQPPGATWQVRVTNIGRFVLVEQRADGSYREVWQGGAPGQALHVPIDGRRVHVVEQGNRYARGSLEFISRAAGSGRPQGYWLTAILPSVEQYLYGLAEVPSSFPEAALEAQAIVGRSFALANLSGTRANCRCQLYDTVFSQVYAGLDKETEGADAQWGRRWVRAVDATRGKVMTYDGRIATGNYSSSAGGHTESAAFVWGGGAPWLQPVDDSRWNLASDDPNITWQQHVSREELGRAFGVGLALSAEVLPPRGTSGRVGDPGRTGGGLRVVGTRGAVTVSGDTARTALGLKSTLFWVTSPPSPWNEGRPVAGDWDGDDDDDQGWFVGGTWYLLRADGSYDVFAFGSSGDVPVVGDWDGDGVDTVGVRRGIRWYLRNRNATGPDDVRFAFGSSSDRHYVVGDWNDDRRDTPGVVRDGNRWLLSNTLRGGNADEDFRYGSHRDREFIVGDWDGDGIDGPGVVRGNQFLLKDAFAGGSAGAAFRFGSADDVQLVGNWDGQGGDTIGVARGRYWFVTVRHADQPVTRLDAAG